MKWDFPTTTVPCELNAVPPEYITTGGSNDSSNTNAIYYHSTANSNGNPSVAITNYLVNTNKFLSRITLAPSYNGASSVVHVDVYITSTSLSTKNAFDAGYNATFEVFSNTVSRFESAASNTNTAIFTSYEGPAA